MKRKVSIVLLALMISTGIILTNFLILTFASARFSVNEAKTNEVLGYFRGINNLDQKYYSIQAITHLKDVKSLIQFIAIVDLTGIITVLIMAIVLVIRKRINWISKALNLAAIIVFLMILTSLIVYLTNFDEGFILLHKLFFRNDLWLFPADDNLIKLFPEAFFQQFTQILLINILITIASISAINYFFKHKHDSKSN